MERTITLGSLFDGAGTCPFAATKYGITPTWASEIEDFPIRVTRKRFPDMVQLGDITQIDGSKITPVDVITFGSPCQDLSVAGKRAGLKGERSCLFGEAVRVIKEMLNATDGKYPRFAMWENVFGAFSSNQGEDFRIVLEELVKTKYPDISIPRPSGGRQRWAKSGSIVANGYSLAWRTFDAQYWGVPQRRRRIHLVVDFRGQCAEEILFKRKGLSRSFAESRKTWNGIAADNAYGAYAARKCFDGRGKGNGNIVPTLTGDHNDRITDYTALVIARATQQGNAETMKNRCPTITAAAGMSGNNQPIIAMNILQDPVSGDSAPALSTGNPKTGQCNIGVCYALDRASFNQGENALYDFSITENLSQTIVAKGLGAVCYPTGLHGEVSGTLDSNYFKGCGERNGTERELIAECKKRRWVVRRLTPKECGRLQGMPDWWCDGVKHKDAPEYKMWGNGMALSDLMYVMEGMAIELRKEKITKLFGGTEWTT